MPLSRLPRIKSPIRNWILLERRGSLQIMFVCNANSFIVKEVPTYSPIYV